MSVPYCRILASTHKQFSLKCNYRDLVMNLISFFLRIRLDPIRASVSVLATLVLLQVLISNVLAEPPHRTEATSTEEVNFSIETLSLSKALAMAIAGSPSLAEFSWNTPCK